MLRTQHGQCTCELSGTVGSCKKATSISVGITGWAQWATPPPKGAGEGERRQKEESFGGI